MSDGEIKIDQKKDRCVSVVAPAYNEKENISPLIEETVSAFGSIGEYELAEIVIVDDGSTDGTREVLRELSDKVPPLTALFLRRNFGQSAALAAGIDHASSDIIVTMDSDLQNDPADIPRLLENLEEGYDCVSGWRKDRKDSLTKKIPSAIQTRLAFFTGPDIHDFGCTLKAYKSEAIKSVDLYGEGHRYIPAKLHAKGYQITELPVNHRPRQSGTSKYGMKRLVKGSLDLIFSLFWNRYSSRPLHFLGGLGTFFILVGVLIGTHTIYINYFNNVSLLSKMPRLVLLVTFIMFGLQILIFGFLAEMITKLRYTDRKPYRVMEVIPADHKRQ